MPSNVLPFDSGKLGDVPREADHRDFVAGSTLTTMSVSVSACLRVSDESMPVSRKLIRDWRVSGVAAGLATYPDVGLVALGSGVGPFASGSSSATKMCEPAS